MNIYEMFGKQSEELQDVVDKFYATLNLLRKLKSGEIALERLTINEKGWDVAPSD